MFLNTLGIEEWMDLNWSKEEKESPVLNPQPCTKRQKESELRLSLARDFLNSLQKVPSHYCRQSTSMVYLETLWLSKYEVYRAYQEYCIENGGKPFKYKRFRDIMDEMKIQIFKPRKDQCDTCVAHKNGNISDEIYNRHLGNKINAQAEKTKDKDDPNTKNVFTMDLQAVLVCPRMKASALYYKTKLSVHNFTINNLKTKDGFCFIWNESQGGVTANEFTTIICNFIKNLNLKSGNSVTFYSDGCNYQNRNNTLANGLTNLAMLLNITITQKYLEKGHTQMECDSMHAAIERRLRNIDITLPSGYMTACRQSRLQNPYVVQELAHSYFLNYQDTITYYSSTTPGKKTGDPQVCDLRALKYLPDGTIQFKLHYDSEWEVLNQRFRKSVPGPIQTDKIPRLYKKAIPIKKTKFTHLQEMKDVLPSDVHSFYDNLTYE